jgi:RNA polymerase-binding transcription factor DksA
MAKLNKVKSKKEQIVFPENVVRPVQAFLKVQLKQLENRRKSIKSEDPFEDPGRALDNAAIDTDAEEQFGHARSAAIGEQLERKMIQTRKALSRIKIGKYGICANCGDMIDTDRLVIYPEATLCVKCEKKKEKI